MLKSYPDNLALPALQPIAMLAVPEALRSSIERQGRNLMELALGLLKAGMDEVQVTAVINQASASYCEELISTIVSLQRAP